LRRRDPDEPRNPHKVSRMNRQIKCGKCNKVGHNSRSCNAGITGDTTWQRRQRLKQQQTIRNNALHALKYLFLYISKVLHALKYLFLFFCIWHWL
jgi:hypothetical protein